MKTLFRWAALAVVLASYPGWAAPEGPNDRRAELLADIDGQRIALPMLNARYSARIDGDLATVTVEQTFTNPGSRPLDATYLFPLGTKAAVHAMTMQTATETVEAKIAKREEAARRFEQARAEGRNAALLTQHRPNMFTQRVANLMPGAPVTITLRYVEPVPKIDGAYELVLPLVVGPRYQPEAPAATASVPADPVPDAGPPVPGGEWVLGPAPEYPEVFGLTLPGEIDPDRVAITVDLDAGMPIADADSPTHDLSRAEEAPGRWTFSLADGQTIDNRDFVLRYRLNGDRPKIGLAARHDERGGFFSLLIEPPSLEDATRVAPREMVFVLDCSGSMAGRPLAASKAVVCEALRRLRPDDSFRIIRFSDAATEFSTQPLPATPLNVRLGLRYLDTLSGMGGTEMSSGILQALAGTHLDDDRRMVVFLTDGYIGNEEDILRLINRHIGGSRLYAFGVGTAVNRWLLDEMGRTGRGFTRYLDPTESLETVAGELADRLQSPVLTDLEIDWGGMGVSDLTVEKLPDLFAGQQLRVLGRYAVPGRHTIRVRGRAAGRAAELPVEVDLPADGGAGEAIALTWARGAVAAQMVRLTTPRGMPGHSGKEEVERRVTELGLTYGLVTQWTSFVAVAEKVVNADSASAAKAQVPVPMVKGVEASAYPKRAPEPGETAAAVFSLLILGWLWRRSRRRPGPTAAARSGR